MEELWRIEKSVPHIPSPLVKGDWVFLWEDKGMVSCVEHATGTIVWNERVPGTVFFGSPVLAQDKMFCVDRDGLVTVIAADKEFKVLATNDLKEPITASPVFSNGRLYLRSFNAL